MGAVAVEGLMRAGGVVVREISAQQTSEMLFVDHDDVIKAFPSDRADDAFGEGILPGRSRGDEDLANPQAFQPWRGKSLFQIGGGRFGRHRAHPPFPSALRFLGAAVGPPRVWVGASAGSGSAEPPASS